MQEYLTATNIIVILTCITSMMLMQDRVGTNKLIFHPQTVKKHKQWYRFLSSGFIHANGSHLFVNMFVLWSFGNAIEKYYYPTFLGDFTTIKFMLLYFGGIIVSSIPSYIRHANNSRYAALGASGGVSAIVFAAIFFAPWQNLYLFAAIPIPQIIAGIGYLYYSWYSDKHSNDNIGHMAHFTGAIWGIVFTAAMNIDLVVRFVQLSFAGPSWL
ncbi:MAG: rhomboid family intramembrane serine protease [Gammaproteobacteria bacterium]|nr:rhomboid family intramembrane serine protease [Gammaproteobacteria bacterium]